MSFGKVKVMQDGGVQGDVSVLMKRSIIVSVVFFF